MMEKNNSQEVFHKTNINWYPGHMVKAQNEIKENLKLIDIVVEVLDARIPTASQNPLIDKLAKEKARIVVLNKYDLADPAVTEKWKQHFESQGIACVVTNAAVSDNIKKVIEVIKQKGEVVYAKKYQNVKIAIKPIYRVLIVGIPNVGKSTIINKIAKRPAANVGNKPGVTRKKQWIRVAENIDLLDTPGLLWPRLEEANAGVKLALTGNIKQEVVDVEELAVEGIKLLLDSPKYTSFLKEKYKLEEQDLQLEAYDLLEVIGRKRGCLVSGGNVDMTKAANIFVEEFKSGKIGKISLE